MKNERKQKGRVVYPLTAQQQAYVGQFPTVETLCAALKAAAGAAASSTSSALTSTSRSAHGYGVQWYEYSLRRLQENPKVAGYVARDVVGRVVPGGGKGA